MALIGLQTLLEEPMIKLRFFEAPIHIGFAIATFCISSVLSYMLGYYLECPFGVSWSIIFSLLIAAWIFSYIPMYYLLGPLVDAPLEHERHRIIEAYEPGLVYAATTLLLYNIASVPQWLLLLRQHSSFVSVTACFFVTYWKVVQRPWYRLLQVYVVFRFVDDSFWSWPGRLILLGLFKGIFFILLRFTWRVRQFVRGFLDTYSALRNPPGFYFMNPDTQYRRFSWMRAYSGRQNLEYEPLEEAEFRLVLVSPSRRKNLLEYMLSPTSSLSDPQLQLVTFKMVESPPYEAISYTWGDALKSEEIILNGKSMAVTEAVHDILLRRADFWKPRYIWIDSICINQENIEERNAQVPKMTEIYENASRVIVWLGYANDASLAVGKLLDIWTLLHAYAPDELFEKLHSDKMEPTETASWTALRRLFSQSWFLRVWIIQEVVVAQEVHVMYGDHFLAWKTLADVMEDFYGGPLQTLLGSPLDDPALYKPQALTTVSRMRQLRKDFHSSSGIMLDHLLASFIPSEAKVDKDKVYALQGLTSFARDGVPILPVAVDYSENTSIEDILIETAVFLVESHQSSWILPVSGVGFSDRSPGLPSWVPQWKPDRMATALSRHITSCGEEDNYPDYRYKSCGDNPSLSHVLFIPDLGRKTLKIYGCCVTKIKVVGPCFPASNLSSAWRDAREAKCWYHDSVSFVHREVQDPYLNGQSITEAFWRTIIGDREMLKPRPAASSAGEVFQVLVELLKMDWTLFENLDWDFTRVAQGNFSQIIDIFAQMDNEQIEMISGLFSSVQTLGDAHLRGTRFVKDVVACAGGRRWGVTDSGHVGFVPPRSMPDDLVCLVYGTQTPYILRRNVGQGSSDSEGTYTLVGECYMHGMMDGEALQNQNQEGWFTII
ncbi:related to heterokaryon incompatibility protein het-6 [Fusarium oxysporum]|uniref:Related to heterokaryon incompatibility protein het-6 n=1 Tax=Fusarium oxysporum TaxID=5507 RepID=A0A2H3STV5_FUSOX|nr:related to heterokaryon incompatibility protein het-6 [Fusarium oxysporum]